MYAFLYEDVTQKQSFSETFSALQCCVKTLPRTSLAEIQENLSPGIMLQGTKFGRFTVIHKKLFVKRREFLSRASCESSSALSLCLRNSQSQARNLLSKFYNGERHQRSIAEEQAQHGCARRTFLQGEHTFLIRFTRGFHYFSSIKLSLSCQGYTEH